MAMLGTDRIMRCVRRVAAISLLLYVTVPSLCAMWCSIDPACRGTAASKVACCGSKQAKALGSEKSCCEWVKDRHAPNAVSKDLDSGPLFIVLGNPTTFGITFAVLLSPWSRLTPQDRAPPGPERASPPTRAPPIA